MKLARPFALLLATSLPAARVAAQASVQPPEAFASAARALEAFAQHERAQKRIPGISVAVARGDAIVWAQGFGWADSAAGAPATGETPWPAGEVQAALEAMGAPASACGAGQGGGGAGTPPRGVIRTPLPSRVDAPPAGSVPAPAPPTAGARARPSSAPAPALRSVTCLARLAGGARRPLRAQEAAPGFALTVLALPGDSVAAVAASSLDADTATTTRLAQGALDALLAVSHGRAPPLPDTSRSLEPGEALRLAGRWGRPRGRAVARLEEFEGALFLTRLAGGTRLEVRRAPAGGYLTDDPLGWGTPLVTLAYGRLVVGPDTLVRVPDPRPPDAPPALARLVGEYGPDERITYILERDRALAARVNGFHEYPLTRVAPGTYRFPRTGPWAGEEVRFEAGTSGGPDAVVAGGVRLQRRPLPGDADAVSFRITPVRPVEELRKEALAASPPKQGGDFAQPDLVELRSLDPTIRYDIRYATANNFMGTPMYSSAHAFLQRPAAEAVARASAELRKLGYGLLIHDAYRPWYVTKMFWDATPPDKHVFVANPANGSRHNRGAAVDLTLYSLRTGQPIRMTGGYDEMSDRSYPLYPGGTSSQRWHRDLLRHVMEAEGFTVEEAEWWHFDYRDWRRYPVLNLTFEQLAPR